MSKEFVEPAFPTSSEMLGHNAGMTLRDYFAAKALPALLEPVYTDIGSTFFTEPDAAGRAKLAYAMADAMLVARSQS
jgi:hypothetical protein